jgi:beta-phosphoglucomutase-like phosphatase (HAD superfamily)
MAGELPRAVIFDLDEVLIDSRPAWRYAIEESVASVTGRRIDARPLVEEYRRRPWRHVIGVVVDSPAERDRCESLCLAMMQRSALKKLLVHEGIGMGLDALRVARVEMGAISRGPHNVALKQVQSTGLDRFLTVMAATPTGQQWDAGARIEQCLEFLGYEPSRCVVVPASEDAGIAAEKLGLATLRACWLPDGCGLRGPDVPTPGALLDCLRRLALT